MAQWEEHYTHTLRTFVGPGIGVTEGQLGLMVILIISAVFGSHIWLVCLSFLIARFCLLLTLDVFTAL
jgi:hypothetical protein